MQTKRQMQNTIRNNKFVLGYDIDTLTYLTAPMGRACYEEDGPEVEEIEIPSLCGPLCKFQMRNSLNSFPLNDQVVLKSLDVRGGNNADTSSEEVEESSSEEEAAEDSSEEVAESSSEVDQAKSSSEVDQASSSEPSEELLPPATPAFEEVAPIIPKWKQRVRCNICGSEYTRSNSAAHKKTKRHQIYLEASNKFLKVMTGK